MTSKHPEGGASAAPASEPPTELDEPVRAAGAAPESEADPGVGQAPAGSDGGEAAVEAPQPSEAPQSTPRMSSTSGRVTGCR